MIDPEVVEPRPHWVRRHRTAVIIVVLAALGCSGLWFSPSNWLRVCHETFRYPGLLEEWRARGPGVADHFPDSIPDDAEDVELSAFPGYLQAGRYLFLRYRIAPGDAARVLERFRGRALYQFHDGEWHGPEAGLADLPVEFLGQPWAGARPEKAPPTKEALVLGPDSLATAGNRNHAQCYGLTADRATGELFCWAMSW